MVLDAPARRHAFETLFSPLRLGPLKLMNRIIAVAHGTAMVERGVPTDDDIAFWEIIAATPPAALASRARRSRSACQDLGGVDYLSLSLTLGQRGAYVKDITHPEGVAVDAAHSVKQHTTLPVVVAGRIVDPTMAEAILRRGAADLVGMARQLIVDPQWPAKARRGLTRSIRPCIGLNQLRRLGQRRVTLHPFVHVTGIRNGSVTLAHALTGDPLELPADIVAAHAGTTSNDDLAALSFGSGAIVRTIGDCVSPRRLMHANWDADRAVLELMRADSHPEPTPRAW